LGIYAALRAGRLIDHVLSTADASGTAMPSSSTRGVDHRLRDGSAGSRRSAIEAGMGAGQQLHRPVPLAVSLSLVILAYIRMMRDPTRIGSPTSARRC
jgi:hypothetical protein